MTSVQFNLIQFHLIPSLNALFQIHYGGVQRQNYKEIVLLPGLWYQKNGQLFLSGKLSETEDGPTKQTPDRVKVQGLNKTYLSTQPVSI